MGGEKILTSPARLRFSGDPSENVLRVMANVLRRRAEEMESPESLELDVRSLATGPRSFLELVAAHLNEVAETKWSGWGPIRFI